MHILSDLNKHPLWIRRLCYVNASLKKKKKSTTKRGLSFIIITSLVIIAHIIACSLDTGHLFGDYIITDYKYNSLLFHHYYYLNLGSIMSFKKSRIYYEAHLRVKKVYMLCKRITADYLRWITLIWILKAKSCFQTFTGIWLN